MTEMKTEEPLGCIRGQGARVWLEDIFESYAIITAMVIASMAESGEIKLRDVCMANELVKTLATISNLVEKERARSGDLPGDFAKRSSR